jgi:hypothetical protein
MIERKYRLEKVLEPVEGSEYRLLGNDGETLWRIFRYGDISAGGWRGMVEVQSWGLRRQKKVLGRWEKFGDSYATRKEAIQAALRSEEAS